MPTLVTPPLSCGALPGITREAVLDIARARGVAIAERVRPGGARACRRSVPHQLAARNRAARASRHSYARPRRARLDPWADGCLHCARRARVPVCDL